MPGFKGFSSKGKHNIQLPPELFLDVLPDMQDLGEIKLVLFVFWYLQSRDENTGYALIEELLAEPIIEKVYGGDPAARRKNLRNSVDKAIADNILLLGSKNGKEFLFLNSPRGEAMLKGLKSGEWQPGDKDITSVPVSNVRPNIFALYEQNIGLLTPLMADTLADAEKIYPVEWIEDAVKIAVQRNARNWRFIDAILRGWKEKGRYEKDQRPAAQDRKRDSEGEFGDFIKH
jgi:DnaD/phage-associated family protein